jgi:alkaline phosphatase D
MLWLPRAAWAQPRLPAAPFGLGVASGLAGPGRLVLWTRLLQPDGEALPAALGDITVRWEWADDADFRAVRRQGTVMAPAALAHSVHVELDGLPAGRTGHYRFAVGGAGQDWVSPVGHARTLPDRDAPLDRLRLAWASCQRWDHGHFAAWRHVADAQPDLVVFVGDYVYETPSHPRAVRSHDLGWCLTLDDYRRRYALYRSDPQLQAAHAAAPWVMTWDDHELQNDYAGHQPGDGGPPVADFAARRAAAYQAYYEHQPLPADAWASALQGPLRVHGHLPLGRLGSLTWLDTRQYRDPQVCTPGGRRASGTVDPDRCSRWHDPARSLLGTAQEAWLDRTLARAGGAGWQLIAQATLFGRRDLRQGPGERFWNDGWDGYPEARRRFCDTLRRHATPNPVLLGGDVHEHWVGHVVDDADSGRAEPLGVEFCGTSISARSNSVDRVAERLAENPHFVWADAEHRGYGLLDLRPDGLQAQLMAVDQPEHAGSAQTVLARFHVGTGQRRLERG